jgi:hypothetical protein
LWRSPTEDPKRNKRHFGNLGKLVIECRFFVALRRKESLRGFFDGEIGSTSSLQVGFDPASPEATPRQVGFDWVCFGGVCKVVHFHNPLLNRSLISFWLFGNWVCIGFVLALIGFVLATYAKSFIFIILC